MERNIYREECRPVRFGEYAEKGLTDGRFTAPGSSIGLPVMIRDVDLASGGVRQFNHERLYEHLNRLYGWTDGPTNALVQEADAPGIAGRRFWIQDDRGLSLDTVLKKLTGSNQVSEHNQLIESNSVLREKVGTVVLQRILMGDGDLNLGNIVTGIPEEDLHTLDSSKAQLVIGRLQLANIDLEPSRIDFNTRSRLSGSFSRRGTDTSLAMIFTGEKINSLDLTRLNVFVQKFDNPRGVAQLRDLGMSRSFVRPFLTINRQLVKTGRYS